MLVEKGGSYNGDEVNSEFLMQTLDVKRDTISSDQTEGKIEFRAFVNMILKRYFYIC